MAYINIKFQNKRVIKLNTSIAKVQKIIDGNHPEAAKSKATELRDGYQATLSDLLTEYKDAVDNAVKNNNDNSEIMNKWHKTAKESLAMATTMVEKAQSGTIANNTGKRLSQWQKVIKQIHEKMKKEGRDLMAAMAPFRGNDWKKAMGSIDKAELVKAESKRQSSISKNAMAAANVKRVAEYDARMGILLKRFVDIESNNAGDAQAIASECKQLLKKVETESADITYKIDSSTTPIQKVCAKIRKCKTDADAVKLNKDYEKILTQALGSWSKAYKVSSGRHKTMRLQVQAFEKKIAGTPVQKALKAEVLTMNKELVSSRTAVDNLKKEQIAVDKRLKELVKTKKK